MELRQLEKIVDKDFNEIETLYSKNYKEIKLNFLHYLKDIDNNMYNGELNLNSIIDIKLSNLNGQTEFNKGIVFDSDYSTKCETYDKFSDSLPYSSEEIIEEIDNNECDEDIYQIAYKIYQFLISYDINVKDFIQSIIEKRTTEKNSVDLILF